MTAADRSPLRELASLVGILPEYLDQTGRETRVTSDDTRRALLGALGLEAATDAAAVESLAALRTESRREVLAPVHVVEEAAAAQSLEARAPSARGGGGSWRLEIIPETGERIVSEGTWRSGERLAPPVPALPIGYHRARLELSAAGGDGEWGAEQSLIVVPSRCVTPDTIVGEHGAFGLTANLYTIRRAVNWGVGDLSDLTALAEWGASIGADFVGVNPLHALTNRGASISPYSPVSRLFRNPIYLDVTRIPELEHAPAVRERLEAPELHMELEALRQASCVRYAQVAAVKGLALDALYRVFAERVQHAGDHRARAYREFVEAAGEALSRFATWMAIAERNGDDWRDWPAELRDPSSPAVAAFAVDHSARVDFHRWVQFELDRQLAEAGSAARAAGMRIGLYQDLAIGSSPNGADTWAFPGLFVDGVNVGAPPDPYAPHGQDWGFPPLDPRALRRDGYRYFIDLVRTAFRHAGALRIDHVMGLFRLFWIPRGMDGRNGAYVRYPSRDLLGIIALESARNGAVVVGEDLGTVPKEVPPALTKWGLLSSKVLQFERDANNGYKPAKRYPPLALATANTHDMATIAGFWQGADIELRLKLGLIDEVQAEDERHRRDADRMALLDRLAREKVLPSPTVPASPAALRGAVHAFLCRTPAQLVGIALDDLSGETEPVNVPGVGGDQFPSWTRKMRDDLEVIAASPDTAAALRCDGRRGVSQA